MLNSAAAMPVGVVTPAAPLGVSNGAVTMTTVEHCREGWQEPADPAP